MRSHAGVTPEDVARMNFCAGIVVGIPVEGDGEGMRAESCVGTGLIGQARDTVGVCERKTDVAAVKAEEHQGVT